MEQIGINVGATPEKLMCNGFASDNVDLKNRPKKERFFLYKKLSGRAHMTIRICRNGNELLHNPISDTRVYIGDDFKFSYNSEEFEMIYTGTPIGDSFNSEIDSLIKNGILTKTLVPKTKRE